MDGNGTPDFVISRYQESNEAPGLPEPQKIILTVPLSGGSMNTVTRNIPVTGLLVEQGSNSHFFHDVNGDGLPDLLGVDITQSDTIKYRLNTGLDFDPTWQSLGFSLPMRTGSYFDATYSEWHPYRMPVMSKTLAIDYNGDGRDDLLYANAVVASSCAFVLSAGTNGGWLCDNDLYGEYQSSQSSHVGSPINGAIADNSVRSYKVVIFSENSSGTITSTTSNSGIYAAAAQTAVVDATGDGLPDVVTVFGCRTSEGCEFNTETSGRPNTVQNGSYVEGAWINRNPGAAVDNPANDEFEYAANDLMNAAEDGLGNRHEWNYRPLSSDSYNKAGIDFYQTRSDVTNEAEDYFHFASSMYVVADHHASNGVGGLNSTKYRYRGAIYNNKGRGFQGFLAIEAEEDVYSDTGSSSHLDKISRTEFYQQWPVSSIVDRSCTWLSDDYILDVTPTNEDPNPTCEDVTHSQNNKQLSSTVTDNIHDVATSGGARFVAVKTQTSKSFDLATHSELVAKTTDRVFDEWGNVEVEDVTHVDAWTSNHSKVTRDYFAIPSWWWLDKLIDETTTHYPVSQRHANSPSVASNQDLIKIATTSYPFYDNTHRLPTTITISANGSSLTQTISTTYNSYGLPTDVSAIGTDVTGPREVITTYSKDGVSQATDGYFPFTVENSLGHTRTQHTDPAHGVAIDTWDPNGLHSNVTLDAFGRPKETTGPGQPTVHKGWNWCGGATWCYAGAVYRVSTVTAGAPINYSYFDQFGRGIYSITRNYADSDYVRVSTQFDERGNTVFQSVPHDPTKGESGNKGSRFLSYDALNRLTSKEVDQTQGQIMHTTYGYAGLTTNINAAGVSMSRTYDGFGRLVETVDGKGGYTRYAYDGAGNPIVIADPEMINSPSIVGIKAAYNALGHKLWVEDPNWWDDTTQTHLSKTFSYNALGEVLSELDPNGNLIEMTYDELGRLVERWVDAAPLGDPELDGKWHYDSTDTYGGLGLVWLEDSQFRADGSRMQKFYYYSDASTGRKDLLQVKHRFYENDNQNVFEEYDTAYFTDGFYARPKGLQYPGGSSVAFDFNSHGHLTYERDPVSGTIYREITDRDSRGQIEAASVGYHSGAYRYQISQGYFPETGQVDYMSLTNGSTSLQNLSHEYDVFGNLDWRSTTIGGGATETLYYDELQRLTTSTRSYLSGGGDTVNYLFDASGTFTSKSDYNATPATDVAATYVKHANRPHVVTQLNLSSGGPIVYNHDKSGNVTRSDGETIDYNAFNKPQRIDAISSSDFADFTYGADLMRYRQMKSDGTRVYYVDKLMEIKSFGSAVDYRHYIGDVAILTKTGALNDPNPGIKYLFRDRLGSVSAIGDTSGLMVEFRAYDPYGRPRNGNWTDKATPELNSSVTDRGFTDHEHLDDWQLIHMNGRGFDYNAGRFLSIDPFIQAPGNSQSINGFAYIMNNPLSGTDPSGYSPIPMSTGTRTGPDGII